MIRELRAWIDRHPEAVPDNIDPHVEVCDRVRVAHVRLGDDETWPDGVGFANHAKLVAVDGGTFYVGSHNLYPFDLAEFGVIVDDEGAAAELYATYLGPLWTHAARTAVSGVEVGGCLAP